MKKLNWIESIPDDLTTVDGRALWVADAMVGHYAVLPDCVSVQESLADYAAGYDAGEASAVRVEWRLYEDGREIDYGRHSWEYPLVRV